MITSAILMVVGVSVVALVLAIIDCYEELTSHINGGGEYKSNWEKEF